MGEAAIAWRIVAGGDLLLERVAQLAVARLHLFEEADVLDGDHRLVGEGLQELNLLVAERAHLGATDHQRADRLPLAQERGGQNCAETNSTGDIAAGWKLVSGSP